jgi:hypothetical protein
MISKSAQPSRKSGWRRMVNSTWERPSLIEVNGPGAILCPKTV